MSAIDRTRRPESGPVRSFDFPEVERRRLANGLDLRVARMSRLPVVSAQLFVRAGEAGLTAEECQRVLRTNAIECYGLDRFGLTP